MMQSVVWRAQIVPHALSLISHGRQQFVFLATLGRLARALDLEIGDLFEWREARTQNEQGLRTSED
jgi:DNA-binding Xre family transcriptional regulator